MEEGNGMGTFNVDAPNSEQSEQGILASLARLYHESHHDNDDSYRNISVPPYLLDPDSSLRQKQPGLMRRPSESSECMDLDLDDPYISGAGENRIDDERYLDKHAEELLILESAEKEDGERRRKAEEALVKHQIQCMYSFVNNYTLDSLSSSSVRSTKFYSQTR
jgi:hypothetical protein